MKTIFVACLMFVSAFIFGAVEPPRIVPEPQSLIMKKGNFPLTSSTVVKADGLFSNEADFFISMLKNSGIILKQSKSASSNVVEFIKSDDSSLGDEGYSLTITDKVITIKTVTPAGAFYAVQTLLVLLPVEVAAGKKVHEQKIIFPCLVIKDKPRFKWRGYMLDEARHFHGMVAVKKILDELALLKMNIFHWHLVDDQGWRIEIKKYPKLTSIGSKRKNTQVGGWKSKKLSGKPHGGFYTQKEITEIVKYAAARHITIVPEIEMPGHCEAAMAAYPEMDSDATPRDVPILFGKHYSCYNPADEKVYKFLENILTEVMAMFPSKVIHIGGDEVKYDHWQNSKEIKDFMQKKGLKSYADLQLYFTNRISKFIESKGRRMMGWNEIMGSNVHKYQQDQATATGELAPNTIVHFWKGSAELAKEAAARGYDFVNSYHKFTYLDYNYRQISLKKAYGFDPVFKGMSAGDAEKTLGIECPMWGEWTPNIKVVERQTYPRLAAYAESGWTELKHKNYDDFLRRMKKITSRWDLKRINYYKKAF